MHISDTEQRETKTKTKIEKKNTKTTDSFEFTVENCSTINNNNKKKERHEVNTRV